MTIAEEIARRKEADRAELERLIQRCHAWTAADRAIAADLVQRLGEDPAAVDQRIAEHRQHHADQQAMQRRRCDFEKLAADLAAREHFQATFGGLDDAHEKLMRFAESSEARQSADSTAYVPAVRNRNDVMDLLLRARGWKDTALGWTRTSGRGTIQLTAVHQQFLEDFAPLAEALEKYATPPAPPVIPDVIDDAAIESLRAKLAELRLIDTSLVPLLEIAQAAKALYVLNVAEPTERAVAHATLNRGLEPLRTTIRERLWVAKNKAWAQPQPAMA